MGMVVRSNIMALNANRQLGMNNSQVSKSLEKLSSGYKINRAGDDASGLAISEKMKAQIKGLDTASANSQDGISLVQTAEGALTEVHDMLNRMVELTGKAANGTIDNDTDRAALQKEMDALLDEIDRIADSTDFNGIKLLNGAMGGYKGELAGNLKDNGTVSDVTITGGKLADTDVVEITVSTNGQATVSKVGGANLPAGVTFAGVTDSTGVTTLKAVVNRTNATAADAAKWEGVEIRVNVAKSPANAETGTFIVKADANGNVGGGLTLQIGATGDEYNKVTVAVGDMSSTGLGINALRATGIMSQDAAATALDQIKTGAKSAINTVSSVRANLGAMQNRLEHTINNLDVATENMQSANSRIRDTDMAKEMMEYTKQNVLTQAAQAMLAQANQQPQSILQLLQ